MESVKIRLDEGDYYRFALRRLAVTGRRAKNRSDLFLQFDVF
jgi:hypothetical protein